MNKEKLFVSFSGGKTSAYMSKSIRADYHNKYDIKFVFANTGLELEETLKFVNRCDREFNLNLTWVEAIVNPQHGIGITHKIVDFETAARNGEPFEAHIAKSGIPNANKPQCSDRLKALVIEHYKKMIGWKGCKHAIGIRADEVSRKSDSAIKKYNICYPLCDWFETDKIDINDFWDEMHFTLNIEDHEGNCATCWKKSDKKLWLIALEHPERFKFMCDMEDKYQGVKQNDNGTPRVFFRKHRSARDMIDEAKLYDTYSLRKMIGTNTDLGAGCSESCEAYV